MRGPVPRQHALRTGRHHGACSGAPTAPSPEPRVPDSARVPRGGGTVLGPHVSEEPFTPACSTPVPSSLGSSRDPAPHARRRGLGWREADFPGLPEPTPHSLTVGSQPGVRAGLGVSGLGTFHGAGALSCCSQVGRTHRPLACAVPGHGAEPALPEGARGPGAPRGGGATPPEARLAGKLLARRRAMTVTWEGSLRRCCEMTPKVERQVALQGKGGGGGRLVLS